MDYGEKIRKLLALSESPNIHEAKSALLKARQLMAEHGITAPTDDSQKVAQIESGISFQNTGIPGLPILPLSLGMHIVALDIQ